MMLKNTLTYLKLLRRNKYEIKCEVMFVSMVYMIATFCFSITINAHTDELSVVYDACERDGEMIFPHIA